MKSPKNYYFFLTLVFAAFLESTIWPIHLVFLLLVIWAFLRSPGEILVTAFFSGLVLDFLTGTTLGVRSLSFLLVLAVIIFLRFRFFPKTLSFTKVLPFIVLFVFFGSIFLSILVNWAESGKLSLFFLWSKAVWEVVLTIVFYPIFEFLSIWWEKREDPQLQLKV
jgi:rod shape-determining protein MreD